MLLYYYSFILREAKRVIKTSNLGAGNLLRGEVVYAYLQLTGSV